ncbi:uncharacterized protein [Apostichopus japonicus]
MADEDGEEPLQDGTYDFLFLQCQDLRQELENMKEAHRLIVHDITSIRTAFKLLVQEAQQQNPVCNTEPTSEYSTDYSTETEEVTNLNENEVYNTQQRTQESTSQKNNTKRGKQVKVLHDFPHIGRTPQQIPNHYQPRRRDKRSSSLAVDAGNQLYSNDQSGFSNGARYNGSSSMRRFTALPHHFVSLEERNRRQRPDVLGTLNGINNSTSRPNQRRHSEFNSRQQDIRTGLGPASRNYMDERRGSLSVEMYRRTNTLKSQHMKSPRASDDIRRSSLFNNTVAQRHGSVSLSSPSTGNIGTVGETLTEDDHEDEDNIYW